MKHWTAAERAEIARLLRERLTAGQIAPKFGRSRSAVIGFVNRDPMLRQIGFQHDRIYVSAGEGTA